MNTLKISVEDFLKICPFKVTKVPLDRQWILCRQGRKTIQTPIIIMQDFITFRSQVR
ncbi:MAG: hypothetical protein ACLUTO_01390 [Anaerostipes sp.]